MGNEAGISEVVIVGPNYMRLSVIVIAKNEAAMIGRCLESVAWADEIIVVDSGSTDGTQDICRALGAKVVVTEDWPGPGPQRNRAIEQASGEWILALDADEWVNEDLRDEILRVIQAPGDKIGFRVKRLSSYCGRYMRHSGWWPDYVSRLFVRGRARYDGGIVHDHLNPEGPMGRLNQHLLHEPYQNLEEVLAKVDDYSTGGAQIALAAGQKGSLVVALGHGFWAFLRTYVIRLGVLDGQEGLMLAISNAETTYYKYLKLWLLSKQRDQADKLSGE